MGANRNFNRKQALDKEIKELYVNVAIGASGAPTLDAAQSLGVASVSRVSAGRYSIRLQDSYPAFRHLTEVRQLASGAPSAVGGVVIRSVDVTSSTPTIVIEYVDGAGAPVELVSGTVLRLEINLKNSTAR